MAKSVVAKTAVSAEEKPHGAEAFTGTVEPPEASGPVGMVAPVPGVPIPEIVPRQRGDGPNCSLCKTKMVNEGVRRTNHPFIVKKHYKCPNPKCLNTAVVETRKR
jgi:hypothetical protein